MRFVIEPSSIDLFHLGNAPSASLAKRLVKVWTGNLHHPSYILLLDDTVLNWVDKVKYLGAVFTDDCSFVEY